MSRRKPRTGPPRMSSVPVHPGTDLICHYVTTGNRRRPVSSSAVLRRDSTLPFLRTVSRRDVDLPFKVFLSYRLDPEHPSLSRKPPVLTSRHNRTHSTPYRYPPPRSLSPFLFWYRDSSAVPDREVEVRLVG